MNTEQTVNVVNTLSALILSSLHEAQHEGVTDSNPDASGDRIKHFTERVESLRDLREMFENEMSRVPSPGY